MAKYIVVKDFTDLQDDNHVYMAGDDLYPRDGYEPSEERIAELSTDKNKRGEVLIQEMEGKVPPEFELENLSAEAIKEYTNDEIKARLDELGIEYKSNDNKDKLIERLLNKEGDQ